MWPGDVLQSKDIVKHSAGILSYGSSSGTGKSTTGTWAKWGAFVSSWNIRAGEVESSTSIIWNISTSHFYSTN